MSEQRDRGPFSTDVLATLILLLSVLLNSAVSLDVRPTPSVPALTSRAGASLSFVFLSPPPDSHPCALQSSRSQSGSSEHIGVWSSVKSLVARAPGSRSQSALSQVLVRESARSLVQVATVSWRPNAAAPSPFRLFSNICARFVTRFIFEISQRRQGIIFIQ